MALNTGINSLDAGAPELRLEGQQQAGGPYNTGSDVKNALAVWNNMGPQDRAEFDGFLDFFRTGAWRDQIQGMKQMQQQRKTAAYGGTARPTYTQSRKQRINAAGGGIMGSNAGSMLVAPTADGSRPGYGWRDYIPGYDAIADFVTEKAVPFVKDKIVDYGTGKVKDFLGIGDDPQPPRGGGPDPIPEWTTPPYVPETVAGPMKFLQPPQMPQGSPGEINPYTPTYVPDIDLSDWGSPMGNIPELPTSTMPQGSPFQLNKPPTTQPPRKDVMPLPTTPSVPTYEQFVQDIFGGGEPTTQPPRKDVPPHIGQPDYGPYSTAPTHTPEEPTFLEKYVDPTIQKAKEIFAPTDMNGQPVQWKIPVAAGIAAHEYQKRYLANQPKFPGDETKIDFKTAREYMDDPKQRFKPKEIYADTAAMAAEGGRIGYATSGLAGSSEAAQAWADLEAAPKEQIQITPESTEGIDMDYMHALQDAEEKAEAEFHEKYPNAGPDSLRLQFILSELRKNFGDTYYNKAQGGRIGYGFGDLVKGLFSGEDETQDTSIYGEPETIQHEGKTYVMPAQIYPSRGTQNLHGNALKEYIKKNEGMKEFYRNNLNMMPSDWIIEEKAQGGRIGYQGGSSEYKNWAVSKGLDPADKATLAQWWELHRRELDLERSFHKAQGGRIGYNRGRVVNPGGYAGDPEIPEGFLEDFKRREYYEFLDKFRRRKEEYERRRDLAPTQEVAQGGRIGAQEGGLMNLGGMEKDYRQEGGFVPIGGQEKADDVPARLSKNEFVFTADAVRAAGGGDIDAGAEVMENLMENLEAGGKVSEESQGLEGARSMFANAQQLEKRII